MNSLETKTPELPYTIRQSSISFSSSLSYDDWLEVGAKILSLGRTIGFQIGDWINFGSAAYGRKYQEAILCTGIPYKTLANYAYIARKVDPTLREPSLGHEHHGLVAKLSPSEQKRWLELATRHNMSVRRLRASIKVGHVVSEEEARPDPADRRHVTYLALINQIDRWWRKEIKKSPPAKWDKERREGLKKDFRRLIEIYESL